MSGAGQFRVQKITGFHVYHEMTPLIIMRGATRIDQTQGCFSARNDDGLAFSVEAFQTRVFVHWTTLVHSMQKKNSSGCNLFICCRRG